MSSSDEIFLTQSKYIEKKDKNYDTDNILNDILDYEDEKNVPNFDLGYNIYSDISEPELPGVDQKEELHSTDDRHVQKERNLPELDVQVGKLNKMMKPNMEKVKEQKADITESGPSRFATPMKESDLANLIRGNFV